MKERPILFSAPMVRALLAGTKRQTRRVVKWQGVEPGLNLNFSGLSVERSGSNFVLSSPTRDSHAYRSVPQPCPYGLPGDRLWVREAWGLHAFGDDTDWLKGSCTVLDLDDHVIAYRANWGPMQDGCHWRPSIHMPRAASRILLEVTEVRVERLQDIRQDDARAEGAPGYEEGVDPPPPSDDYEWDYCTSFRRVWEAINGPGSWAANPWVWAVSFRRIATPAA